MFEGDKNRQEMSIPGRRIASRKEPKWRRAWRVSKTLEGQGSWKAVSRSESHTDEAGGTWVPDHTGPVASEL